MKSKLLLLSAMVLSLSVTACGNKETPNTENPTGTPVATETPDATSSASIVSEANDFIKAISADGTWIIATLNDMEIDQDITLDGEFTNGKKDDAGKDVIQRKVALYTQDDQRNITNRFTLKAPSFTINSPNASIQHGTFVGDLYVNVENFQLVDTTVEGNVYFKDEAVKNSFTMDDASKVTGTQDIK